LCFLHEYSSFSYMACLKLNLVMILAFWVL
jgi:hypothetical protein